MILARFGDILRSGAWGEDPVLAASGFELEAWDFRDGWLANAQAQWVQVVDLNQGASARFDIALAQEVIYAQVLWGETTKTLLYAAVIQDPEATRLGRSVWVLAIAPTDGRELGRAILRDIAGVTLLRYDDATQQVALIPFGDDEGLTAVERYDLHNGQRLASVVIAGQGEAALSPDGRWLLTQQLGAAAEDGSHLLLTDLATGTVPRIVWEHPARSHGVSFIWSPDGRYVAYLLRDGQSYHQATMGRGLWVFDISLGEARQVLDLSALNATLVGWASGDAMLTDAYIVGYQRTPGDPGRYFAVRADGGGYRTLGVDAEAQILGWMSRPLGETTVVAINPWVGRLAAARGDSEVLAQEVAQYVISRREQGAGRVQQELQALLGDAGWEMSLGQPGLYEVEDSLWLAQLPPFDIYALQGGEAHLLANGNLVLDARRDGDELGLIYGAISASAVQPSFSLYRRDSEGAWQMLWTPQGQRDWVATDGEIRWLGQGMQGLEVQGTSFGLENGVFHECHICPHRKLIGRWVRQGDAFIRQTELARGAPLDAIYWEMTEHTPYAVLYEFLRRLRANLSVTDLVEDPRIVAEARVAGIVESSQLLLAEQETADKVHVTTIEGQTRWIAQVRKGKLVAVQKAP